MSYFYLGLLLFFSGIMTVLAKFYNNKNIMSKNPSGLYNIIVPLGACFGYAVPYFLDFAFEPRVLIYSLIYGCFYTLFTTGMIGALKVGASSITALVKQTSLVGVSIWGFLFLSVPVTVNAMIGILLIIVALCLCLIEKKHKGNDPKANFSTLKMLPYLAMIVVGNIACPLTLKYTLMSFDVKYGHMMLFFALAFSALMSVIFSIHKDRSEWLGIAKRTGYLPLLAGISSSITGIMQTVLLNLGMSTTIIYPSLAVGGIATTLIFSIFTFKERLRPIQWCGIAIGAVALVLLNI